MSTIQARDLSSFWTVDPGSLKYVCLSENHVARFEQDARTYFLRLAPKTHRTRQEIACELDFVRALHDGGALVARPVKSLRGRWVETVSVASEQLCGCVFEAIEGGVFEYQRSPSPEKHFWRVGRALGKIHALSRVFAPTGATRFSWIEDRTLTEVDEYLPANERAVRDKLEGLLAWAKAQPRGRDRYGLIHGDFGAPNYRIAGDSIYAFDFDDCCQHWFAYDLAVALYPHGWREGARKLLDRLLEGYAESMDTCVEPEQIERFCELREVYMFLHQMRKQRGVPSERYTSEWFERKRAAIARGYRIND